MKCCEIEIKLRYSRKPKIISLFKKLGAKLEEKYQLRDSYFSFHNSMSNSHELVRIREKGRRAELTFKGKCEDTNKIWKRTEISLDISSPEHMKNILGRLGLKLIKENVSKREIYRLGRLEIAFIQFLKPRKINLIELEGPKKLINAALAKLGNLVKKVGEETFATFDNAK